MLVMMFQPIMMFLESAVACTLRREQGARMSIVIEPFFFDRSRLESLADELVGVYAANQPFPHIVIDGFLPDWVVDAVIGELPETAPDAWIAYNDPRQVKKATEDDSLMPAFTRHLLSQFNSAAFVNFLERLTGVSGLIVDPHFRGGGLHSISRGGFLGVHADFNRHQHMKLDRRLNVLLYLNRDWQEQWGGALEFWDPKMQTCVQRIVPVANRCVVFSTTDTNFHGHPDPLECPEGRTRSSMALYYYSNGRPSSEVSASRTTKFVRRDERDGTPLPLRERLVHSARRVLPPILFDRIPKGRRRS